MPPQARPEAGSPGAPRTAIASPQPGTVPESKATPAPSFRPERAPSIFSSSSPASPPRPAATPTSWPALGAGGRYRKTLPGLRIAQKIRRPLRRRRQPPAGLWDAILIKENHILAAGGIAEALEERAARRRSCRRERCRFIQIEVENLAELESALAAGATMILSTTSSDLRQAAKSTPGGRARSRSLGQRHPETIRAIAETGVTGFR